MAVQEFRLQLGIPKEYPKTWKRRYSYYCHNSDGLNNCECMSTHSRVQEDCAFFGRPIEPLAFYLAPFSDANQQKQSPLYGILPKEIRDLVFEYALADDGIPAPDSDNVFRRERGVATAIAPIDIACALLRTCKAVYLETYRLPMLLNGYLSYRESGPWRPDLALIAPWQYALIQRIDVSVQQVTLETGGLQSELEKWHAALRHSGAYVAPHFYSVSRPTNRTDGVISAHNFGLTTFGEEVNGWRPEDGDKVTLPNACASRDYDHGIGHYYLQTQDNFIARAMVARPLTHLTIRMSRTDWWTWTDDPNTKDDEKQLALDPACGVETRPLLADMLSLAENRRAGQHPVYNRSWGTAIGNLPDLKTFELILETFLEKRRQLDVVVDSAKTWKFPLKDTNYELVCDGIVENLNWTNTADEANDWQTETDSESQAMDIDDSDGSTDAQSEDNNIGVESSIVGGNVQDSEDEQHVGGYEHDVVNEDASMAETGATVLPSQTQSNQSLRLDTTVGGPNPTTTEPQAHETLGTVTMSFSPLSYQSGNFDHGNDLESPGYTANPLSYTDSPISPMSPGYSPTSPMYSPNYSYNSSNSQQIDQGPWYERAVGFEVRIVRFRRRRMD